MILQRRNKKNGNGKRGKSQMWSSLSNCFSESFKKSSMGGYIAFSCFLAGVFCWLLFFLAFLLPSFVFPFLPFLPFFFRFPLFFCSFRLFFNQRWSGVIRRSDRRRLRRGGHLESRRIELAGFVLRTCPFRSPTIRSNSLSCLFSFCCHLAGIPRPRIVWSLRSFVEWSVVPSASLDPVSLPSHCPLFSPFSPETLPYLASAMWTCMLSVFSPFVVEWSFCSREAGPEYLVSSFVQAIHIRQDAGGRDVDTVDPAFIISKHCFPSLHHLPSNSGPLFLSGNPSTQYLSTLSRPRYSAAERDTPSGWQWCMRGT